MAEPRFTVERVGERVEARAPGIDRKHLVKLRRGETPVDLRIDLHGLSASEARRLLRAELEEAHAAGQRCVLVVHGRGLHSEGAAVLKDGVVEWLASPPLAGLVMAFASAQPADGGPGASYVLLRRTRPR